MEDVKVRGIYLLGRLAGVKTSSYASYVHKIQVYFVRKVSYQKLSLLQMKRNETQVLDYKLLQIWVSVCTANVARSKS
jgi:hypothetical protein